MFEIKYNQKTNRQTNNIIWFLAVFILISCNLSQDNTNIIPQTGVLSLDLGSTEISRTVVPSINIFSYNISFSNGPEAKASVSTTLTNPDITLAIGSWDIQVEALDSGENIIASGGVSNISISADTTTSVTITLNPLTNGTGTVDIILTWPESIGIDTIEASLDDVTINLSETTAAGTVTLRYTQDISTGNYKYRVYLKTGTVLQAMVLEMVQIYGNLTSSEIIALTTADFTSPPEAPTGLSVTPETGKNVISWTDNSYFETGFVVERSTGDNTSYTILDGSIAASTTTYDDTAVTTGVTYYYRVKTVNSFGESAYSNEEFITMTIPVVALVSPASGTDVEDTTPALDWSASTHTSEYYDLQIATDSEFTNLIENLTGLTTSTFTRATALTNGQTYYWKVKATTVDGTYGIWTSDWSFLIDVDAGIIIDPDIDNPVGITFSGAEASITEGNGMTVTAVPETTVDSYQWYLDSTLLAGETADTITIGSELGEGNYILTVVVQVGDVYSSSSFNFDVLTGSLLVGLIAEYLFNGNANDTSGKGVTLFR